MSFPAYRDRWLRDERVVPVMQGRRIVIVGPLPPPAGGMANQTRQLAELLGREGADVEVLQVNAPYQPAWLGSIKGVRALARLIPYLVRLFVAARRAEIFHVMANSGLAWHLFAAPAIWIAHWFRVPVVVNYRGGLAGEFLARSANLVRFTMRRADVLAVPSGFLQKVFSEHGMGSCVVSNIVDLERFAPSADSETRPGRVHVVIARNLEPIYDVATGVRAFALFARAHPEATLSIAGTGPARASLETQVQDAGLQERVRFTGRLDRDQMAALYRSSDIVLNPTLVDNMPNSVLEAMASGVPVVSTDVGGVPYIVTHDKTALLVPAGDAERMAAALSRLADSADLRESIRAAALTEVRRYSWPNVRAELLSVYARCLGLQGGRLTAS